MFPFFQKHGIAQFLAIYKKARNREDTAFKWGDETEYTIVKFDHKNIKVRVCLRGDEIVNQLQAETELNSEMGKDNEILWAPEVGGYMIEGTPGHPYGALLPCLNLVETNMIKRRKAAEKYLDGNEALLSMSFPALGTLDFTDPPTNIDIRSSVGKSLFYPDEVIHQAHPRYRTLLNNIVGRRGEKLVMNVPIFKDEKTPNPFLVSFFHFGSDPNRSRNSWD